MVNQLKLDKTYIKMAEVLAELSYAQRAKVGCLVVMDTHIISEGVNGTPAGFDNNCEEYNFLEEMTTKPEVLHAESNAIAKLAKSTQSSLGATLYTTRSPCFDCAKIIIQAGIKRVVYKDEYRKTDGIRLLIKAGLDILHWNEVLNYGST